MPLSPCLLAGAELVSEKGHVAGNPERERPHWITCALAISRQQICESSTVGPPRRIGRYTAKWPCQLGCRILLGSSLSHAGFGQPPSCHIARAPACHSEGCQRARCRGTWRKRTCGVGARDQMDVAQATRSRVTTALKQRVKITLRKETQPTGSSPSCQQQGQDESMSSRSIKCSRSLVHSRS
jgi:hypothetical protein